MMPVVKNTFVQIGRVGSRFEYDKTRDCL